MKWVAPRDAFAPRDLRFQYGLHDLLLFSALTGAGLALCVPFLTFGRMGWYPPYLGPEAQAALLAGGLLLVALAAAGFLSMPRVWWR